MRVVYLHGFASSPASSKATFLERQFTRAGIPFYCPNLNEPDFSTLTTSRMVEQVVNLVDGLGAGRVVLFGSSLGAFVALCVANKAPAPIRHVIDALVLLAPALDFGQRPIGDLGLKGMTRWRDTGWWEFNHHAYGKPRRVHYELFRDAASYDTFAIGGEIPTLILQGSHDSIVDPMMATRFAKENSSVKLVMLDDDHQLSASLDRIWSESAQFLALTRR